MTTEATVPAHIAKLLEVEAKREAADRADLVAQIEEVAAGPDAEMAGRARKILDRLDVMLAEAKVVRALNTDLISAYIMTGKNPYGQPVSF